MGHDYRYEYLEVLEGTCRTDTYGETCNEFTVT
jgi:hypothetical protein